MAVKKKGIKEKEQEVKQVQQKFRKEQILTSEKYRNKKDLVNALLDKDKTYTFEVVDKTIEDFMKGKVE